MSIVPANIHLGCNIWTGAIVSGKCLYLRCNVFEKFFQVLNICVMKAETKARRLLDAKRAA